MYIEFMCVSKMYSVWGSVNNMEATRGGSVRSVESLTLLVWVVKFSGSSLAVLETYSEHLGTALSLISYPSY